MSHTASAPTSRFAALLSRLARLAGRAMLVVFALLVTAQLVFFVLHAAHMLGYPFPLDYGEGPLLTQISLLRTGLPFWQLYANPDQPPYAVVNYPPLYHLAATLVAFLTNNALLAGRIVSLLATGAALAALWLLTGASTPGPASSWRVRLFALSARVLLVAAFLAIPIVREWAVVVRVDMLGVALGLWALVLVQRNSGRSVLWAAPLLALSLLVKPSLLAAPGAALLWLLFRDWRRALLVGLLAGAIGGIAVGLLEYASGGWFLLHVIAANANAWDAQLAYGFWHDQLVILWPLLAAAGIGAAVLFFTEERPRPLLLPLYYTLVGACVAYGVGKVGAYTNYFLEFYAGLTWLAAAGAWRAAAGSRLPPRPLANSLAILGIVLLALGAQLRYYPQWSETYLKTAGLIEGRNPPRLALGNYGVWQDLRRERDLLQAFSGINAALVEEVQAAGAPIFTDVPGVAAQAGQLSRVQAFEYRQLLDAGLADQRALLRDMANGRVPLVVLDYLGNWLSPEMITLITHRYAQDGSRGTYDLYRPVAIGPAVAAALEPAPGLRMVGYHLAPAPDGPAFHPGETALLTLEWQASAGAGDAPRDVIVELRDAQGQAVLHFKRPLLYGALAPSGWGGATMQHVQPLALPPELPPGSYQLALALGGAGAPQPFAMLQVAEANGRLLGERGYYVPAPLLAAWRQFGSDDPAGPGDPIMPAVPFDAGTLQCFSRACIRLANGAAERLPLGGLVHLADAGLRANGTVAAGALSPEFRSFWEQQGGEEQFGPPITGELIRGAMIVQYTRYARLERPIAGGAVRAGALGDEFLRLPGGGPYRWPDYPH